MGPNRAKPGLEKKGASAAWVFWLGVDQAEHRAFSHVGCLALILHHHRPLHRLPPPRRRRRRHLRPKASIIIPSGAVLSAQSTYFHSIHRPSRRRHSFRHRVTPWARILSFFALLPCKPSLFPLPICPDRTLFVIARLDALHLLQQPAWTLELHLVLGPHNP